ncbi:MAG TPA: YifB family Mg chelatase-like AAA ATPase [Candidatus Paceibacterota bacterium]|nr:YifB family Mg chelatase-like AAA ATPase [Candidatus Paceibacterota bacterium]HRZ34248.1 YifB family Mg chelatase-like AAA ATPase [Candidatus Paceibacterota bacterium]
MYFSKVHSAQAKLLGADGVDVEVDITRGLYSIIIVGLPDKAVEEAKDRVSAAIKNSGFIAPKQKNQKLVISLAPADLKKSGTCFDVPIAIAYLLASRDINAATEHRLFIGELSLDGKLRPVCGVLPVVLFAKQRGFKEVFVPAENLSETFIAGGIKVFGAKNLNEIIDHISGKKEIVATNDKNEQNNKIAAPSDKKTEKIFDEIVGAEIAKRGLVIAASGGHNIALYGPPGTGKTMLAKSLPEILPPLNDSESIECSSIYSVNGQLNEPMVGEPPFRAPHHTSSYASIIGGGNNLKSGEITLAHNGVLFLDEFPEFDRRVIDSLRQPLEEKNITVSRAVGTIKFPAKFILIVSMNPCPCGYFKTGIKPCLCSQNSIQNYRRKISGPIVDRIDLWVEVAKVDYKKLCPGEKLPISGRKSNEARLSIKTAREIQVKRAGKLNSELAPREIKKFCVLDEKTQNLLNRSAERLDLSARSYYKIIKLARTIADIESSEKIKEPHILEALRYRPKDLYG